MSHSTLLYRYYTRFYVAYRLGGWYFPMSKAMCYSSQLPLFPTTFIIVGSSSHRSTPSSIEDEKPPLTPCPPHPFRFAFVQIWLCFQLPHARPPTRPFWDMDGMYAHAPLAMFNPSDFSPSPFFNIPIGVSLNLLFLNYKILDYYQNSAWALEKFACVLLASTILPPWSSGCRSCAGTPLLRPHFTLIWIFLSWPNNNGAQHLAEHRR